MGPLGLPTFVNFATPLPGCTPMNTRDSDAGWYTEMLLVITCPTPEHKDKVSGLKHSLDSHATSYVPWLGDEKCALHPTPQTDGLDFVRVEHRDQQRFAREDVCQIVDRLIVGQHGRPGDSKSTEYSGCEVTTGQMAIPCEDAAEVDNSVVAAKLSR